MQYEKIIISSTDHYHSRKMKRRHEDLNGEPATYKQHISHKKSQFKTITQQYLLTAEIGQSIQNTR